MQKGFSAILVLVGLVAVLVVVGGIFYVGRLITPKTNSDTSQATSLPSASTNNYQQPSPSVQQPTKTDDTANWKTYKSQIESFTFKYPANWQLREEPKVYHDGSKSVWDEAVTLLSSDEFNLELRVGNSIPSSRPGKCSDYDVTEMSTNSQNKISRIITSYEVGGIFNSIGLSDKNTDERKCSDPYFNSQIKDGRIVMLHGFYTSPAARSQQDTYTQSLKAFDGSPSVQIAKKILNSVTY